MRNTNERLAEIHKRADARIAAIQKRNRMIIGTCTALAMCLVIGLGIHRSLSIPDTPPLVPPEQTTVCVTTTDTTVTQTHTAYPSATASSSQTDNTTPNSTPSVTQTKTTEHPLSIVTPSAVTTKTQPSASRTTSCTVTPDSTVTVTTDFTAAPSSGIATTTTVPPTTMTTAAPPTMTTAAPPTMTTAAPPTMTTASPTTTQTAPDWNGDGGIQSPPGDETTTTAPCSTTTTTSDWGYQGSATNPPSTTTTTHLPTTTPYDSVIISVDSVKDVSVGDIITVDVNVSDYHCIVAGELYLQYDPDVLQLQRELFAASPNIFSGAYALSLQCPAEGDMELRFSTSATVGSDQGGTILRLTFQVKEGIGDGTTILCEVPEMISNHGNGDYDTPVTVINGTITSADQPGYNIWI